MATTIGTAMMWMTRRIASDTFRRNNWSGIRVEATMASEQAWQVAHRAALPWFRAAAVVCLTGAFAFAVLLVVRASDDVVLPFYIGIFALLTILVIVPVPRAIRAARGVPSDPPPRGRGAGSRDG